MLYLSCMGLRDYESMTKMFGLLMDPKFIRTLNKKHKDRIHTFTLEWSGENKIVVSGSLKYLTKQGEPHVKFIVHECTWTCKWGWGSNKVESRWITKTNRNKIRVSRGMSSHLNNHVRESIKHFGAQKWSINQVSWDWSKAIGQPREQSEKV
jgi:hypothetical protein